jgi:hypothetical protein
MEPLDAKPGPPPEGEPPVFKTWKQLYAFVLILHAIIILLFYLFTQRYA